MYDKGDRDDDKDDRNLLLYDKGDKDNDKYDGNLLLYDKGDKDDDKDDGNLLLYYKGDKDDGNLLLYDNGDKVNPLEPLRRGTKVGEKWQNGLQASKPYMQKTCDVAGKAILAKINLRKKCVNRDKM